MLTVLINFHIVQLRNVGEVKLMKEVDLRSDTVTHPSPEMRDAIANAKIGDDVFSDDPSVNRLEEMAANAMGKEAAVYVASGTMGNLVSLLAHAGRGQEVILGDKAHIFRSEGGGAAALGGISYHLVPNDDRGMINPDSVAEAIRDSANHHNPKTALIAMENTQNNCGGRVLTPQDMEGISNVAKANEIPLHVDGARIFNAAVKLETPVIELVKDADSVSFCLSKGLSCPVGSVVCGTNEFIEEARRMRKMVGGGMRQAGFMAAAGIVALDTMVERLAEDHTNAAKLAYGLSNLPGISIDPESVETNLVFFEVNYPDRAELTRKLEAKGVKGGSSAKRWRFVTHYGITAADVDYTLDVLGQALAG